MGKWKEVGTEGRGFSAYLSTEPYIETGTFTTVLFANEDFDTDSKYDTTTGKYTPQVAGYYSFSANVVFKNVDAGKKYITYLQKNATGIAVARGVSGGSDFCGGCVSKIVYMNGSTDYVQVQCYHNNGVTTQISNAAGMCVFSGWLLPAP